MTVDLYWLPLGAGGHCVRVNGLVYEAVAARRQALGLNEPMLVQFWHYLTGAVTGGWTTAT